MAFEVRIESSGNTFQVEDNESVLDAALRQGLKLPYGCRNGACRSCKGKLIEGDVGYPEGTPKALTPLDDAQGWTLFCKAHAKSDLRIDVEEIVGAHDIVVRMLPCRVMEKRELCHDVVELRLTLAQAERLQFLAGQYVDIVLRDGRRRAFSLANAPHDDDHLELQIRHVPGGEFSGYVFENLKEKALLRIRGPLGSFYLRKKDQRPVILMAGGTGFSPIKSIIEDALHEDYPHEMHLYWGVRSKRDLYMHDLATRWAEQHPNVHYTPVLSDPVPEDAWDGRTGFVHQAVAEDFDDLSSYSVYMSGPPVMVNAGRESFGALGLDQKYMHSDSFDYAYETGHDEK
ncbi:MAG: CDP-6-deoxy-delta-3,4-glucoseen reductase [Gammaproteobacteria bacterium]|nr:CDP-6-deoxy-delta-3,4-glucoseen reductase [Gammaproteobacteria bacterium]